jgi:hypothetical protein
MRSTKLQIAIDNLVRRGLTVSPIGDDRGLRWTVSNADGTDYLKGADGHELVAYARESARRLIMAKWDAENPLGTKLRSQS